MSDNKLTYKKKLLYLIGGGIAFLFIVYLGTLSKTIDLFKENKEIKEKIAAAEGAELSVIELQARLQTLDKYISLYVSDSLANQQIILETISDLCKKHNIILKNFPKAGISPENGFSIETNIIEAEGNFVNLLHLIDELEQRNRAGRVSSINFKTYNDNKSKRLILSLVIYLQSIRFDNDEAKI